MGRRGRARDLRVAVATDPGARDDAYAKMRAFLRERLAP